MNIEIRIEDPVSPALRKVEKDAEDMHDAALGKIAEAYWSYMRQGYLRGQMIGMGAPYKAAKFKRRRRGLWWVYFGRFNALGVFEKGTTIEPVRKSILRFWDGEKMIFAHKVQMPKRPFVSTSLNAFLARGADVETGSKWFWRDLEKRGLTA